MTSSRIRVTVAMALAALSVVLMLAAAIRLSHRDDAAALASKDCGPVTADEQLSLLWLATIRRDDAIPLVDISLGACDSGVRSAVTAYVEVGRSESVQTYFTDRYNCDVKQVCMVAAEEAVFLVRLDFTTDAGWRLTVRPGSKALAP